MILTSEVNLLYAGEDFGLDVAAVVAFDGEEAADAVRELGEGDEGELQQLKQVREAEDQ